MSLSSVQLHLVDNMDTARRFYEWAKDKPTLAVDTETTGYYPDKDRVRLIQFGDERQGWAIPVEEPHSWSGLVQQVLRNHQGQWVGHNLKFDRAMIRGSFGYDIPLDRAHDTMIMHHILNPHLRSALKSVAVRLIDPLADAGDQLLKEDFKKYGWDWDTVPVTWVNYSIYGALDTVLTARLHEQLYPQVTTTAPKAYDLELATSWLVETVERRGVRVDREYAAANLHQFQNQMEHLSDKMHAEYGVRPGATASIVGYLSEQGFEFDKKTKAGATALDKAVLGSIDHPLARDVLRYRQLQKLGSTYLKNFIEMTSDEHPFLHPSINSLGFKESSDAGYGVKTSRMSMSNPNLQNLPRAGSSAVGDVIRTCIVPRPGHTLLFCDLSQIESRLMAHFSQDKRLMRAFDEGDFFVNMARETFRDPSIDRKDPRRSQMKTCVPTDNTQIFTKRGWLTYDQVRVGDQTLGFDDSSGNRKLIWTTVTAVHVYKDQDVFRYGHSFHGFECTQDHEWLAESRYGTLAKRAAKDLINSEWSLIHSAPWYRETSILTPKDAAILGWLVSDGRIERGVYIKGAKAQSNGTKISCKANIFQKKDHGILLIEKLLEDVPHRKYSLKGGGYIWTLDPTYARSLLDKVNVRSNHDYDPWQIAMSLNAEARKAMLDAIKAADGHIQGSTYILTKGSGTATAELIRALIFLSGKFPKTRTELPNGKGWQRNPIDRITESNTKTTNQRTTLEYTRNCNVWCVTTELGTWVMRQGDQITLTGNCTYATLYGAGVGKLSTTLRMSIKDTQEFLDNWHKTYPGLKKFSNRIVEEARENYRKHGLTYISSPNTNRPYVVDQGKEYVAENRLIQGTAAEIFKTLILRLEAAGLAEYMILFVHDEVILDVPNELVHDVAHVLRDTMNCTDLISVPVSADVSYGDSWGRKRDYVFK